MSLKYDNLRFYWAVVTEKKRLNSVCAKVSSLCARPLRWNSIR